MGRMNQAAGPFGLALCLGAVAMLGLGIYSAWEAHRFNGGAATTEGVVTEMVGRENLPGRMRQFAPVVDYVVAGKTYRLRTDRFAFPPRFAVGDKLTVAYPPDAPGNARLGGFRQSYTTGILLMLGALALGGMGAMLWKSRSRPYSSAAA